VLSEGLHAAASEIMFVERGLGSAGRNMQLRSHRVEEHRTGAQAAAPVAL
jgi:hypothetical protein